MDQQPDVSPEIDPRAVIVPAEGEQLEEGDPRGAVSEPDKEPKAALLVKAEALTADDDLDAALTRSRRKVFEQPLSHGRSPSRDDL